MCPPNSLRACGNSIHKRLSVLLKTSGDMLPRFKKPQWMQGRGRRAAQPKDATARSGKLRKLVNFAIKAFKVGRPPQMRD